MAKGASAALFAIAVFGLVPACGSAGYAGGQATPASRQRAMYTATSDRPSMPVPTPPNFCTGASDYNDVSNIVTTGAATVAVEATVTDDPPVDDASNDRLVKLADVTVVAGSATAGPIEQVHETDSADTSELPTGSYLLLLGANAAFAQPYYLADGMQGSFTLADGVAHQRCPNYADPSQPVASSASVPVSDLVQNLDRVFSDAAPTPAPPTS